MKGFSSEVKPLISCYVTIQGRNLAHHIISCATLDGLLYINSVSQQLEYFRQYMLSSHIYSFITETIIIQILLSRAVLEFRNIISHS